jgi:hypothetical protein
MLTLLKIYTLMRRGLGFLKRVAIFVLVATALVADRIAQWLKGDAQDAE